MSSLYRNLEATHYEAIRRLEKRLTELEFQLEAAKRLHGFKKNELKHASAELRQLLHMDPAQQTLPGMEFDPDGPADDPDARPAWREYPLSLAIHSAAYVEKMREAGIANMGDLSDWTAAGKTLTSINGIGEQAEAKILNELDLFWKQLPQ